jgi:hypothetical protein
VCLLVQTLSLPVRTQLLQLTRLDLSHMTLQSDSQAALKQICQLSALRLLQLGFCNILGRSKRSSCLVTLSSQCCCCVSAAHQDVLRQCVSMKYTVISAYATGIDMLPC